MALFGKHQPRWQKTFRLRGHFSAAKGLLAVLFWVWGGFGLLFIAAIISGLIAIIGLKAPSDRAVLCLFWIGGLILFGVGALIAQSDFDGERPLIDEPSNV